MSDIVERLRGYAADDHERGCQGRYYDCSCGYDAKRDPLMNEAADEIEKLRAALVEAIEFADQDYMVLTPTGEAMVARWRAALGGGDE